MSVEVDAGLLELAMEIMGEKRIWKLAEIRGFILGAVIAFGSVGIEEEEAIKKLASAAPRMVETRGLSAIPEEYQGWWEEAASLYQV